MLSVCLVFLYILLSTYIAGFLVLSGIERLFAKKDSAGGRSGWKADACVMAGLAAVTVYAQFFSLFYKVGLLANLILMAVCAGAVFVCRRKLLEGLKDRCGRVSDGKKVFYVFLFFLFAYGTSRGIIHYDTGLYHAQSIRWIEEFGVVKGLGNLHCRLAYNSAAFALSALYSFSFLGGQSYHCTAGFFALVLAAVCTGMTDAWKRKRIGLADVARAMGIYYLMIIFDEMVSPASDYFMVLTVFYIVIRYLDLVEEGEKGWLPYGLLALLCVYTVSLKLSAALIVLLAIKPAVMMIRERNGRAVAGFIGLGILILTPYLIRNVLISGWLVYPFTALDFFPVDWKIPKGLADYDSREIQVWGRGIYDVARYGEPVRVWLREWFAMQGRLDKLFIAAGVLAAPVSLAAFVIGAVKGKEKQRDQMFGAVAVNVSFLFWLFSAPLIRYGCVYVWLAAPLTFGGIALWLIGMEGKRKYFWRAVYGLLLAAGGYKLFAFGKEAAAGYRPEYFLVQKDYENFQAESYEINGITFYYPVEGDRIGYEAFPSSPAKAEIRFLGTGLRDGFMHKE